MVLWRGRALLQLHSIDLRHSSSCKIYGNTFLFTHLHSVDLRAALPLWKRTLTHCYEVEGNRIVFLGEDMGHNVLFDPPKLLLVLITYQVFFINKFTIVKNLMNH